VPDDLSQNNTSSVNNEPITLIADVPKPYPLPELVPPQTPSRIIPRPPSPTTIPNVPGISRLGGRILPWVNIAITANDTVILGSIFYEWYEGQNRERSGQAGDFTFPVQPSPLPYVDPTYPTDPVGDPTRIDTVVREQVNGVLENNNTGNSAGQPADRRNDAGNGTIGSNPEIARINRELEEGRRGLQELQRKREAEERQREQSAAQDWKKPPPNTDEINPDATLPSTTLIGDDPNWTTMPLENPNSPADAPLFPSLPADAPFLPPQLPGLNLDEPRQRPHISGGPGIFQPRASREAEPANNDAPIDQPEPENPAETGQPASDESQQQPANNSAPSNSAVRAQEAKKRKVEEDVAKLDDADRDIRNLPDGLEKRLNDVGYRINRGDTPSISYRGNLPSKSQLHLDENGRIEQGPPAASNRISNQNAMKKNVLEGTGVKKVPEGYQVNHNTPDAVWQKSPLLQRADELGVGGGVDGQNNLTIMPKNKAAAESTNADVETLSKERRLLKNINHNGSHSKWNEHAAKAYDDEEKILKDKYGSLENAPPEAIEKSVKKVQDQLRNELIEVDLKIEKGEINNLPKWAQPDKKDPGRQRLSDRTKPQNILADNPKLAALLGKVVRDKTKAIINAHTYDLNFSAISEKTLSPKGSAQLLGISALSSFNGTDTNLKQNKHYKMERSGSNILISNLPGGEKLAVIDMDKNTIAMHRPLSQIQVDFLQEKLEQARVASEAAVAPSTLAQSRSSQKQIEM
jgi:hypothetical protein